MTPEDESARLKQENAALLKEKADAVALWHDEVRLSLKTLTSEIALIKLNTNELPQLRANQESQAVRIRVLEDFRIIMVALYILTVAGFVLYVNSKVP